MKVERQYFRVAPVGAGVETVYCGKDEATGTRFVFSDTLEDGTEYGLALDLTEVVDKPSNQMLEYGQKGMDTYLEENGP